jgi:DNA-binding NarL/FixJ family response regulator
MQRIVEKARFLIIDDFSEFRLSVKYMLQRMGARQILQAATAEEALSIIKREPVDVLLCDYNLGDGQDGQQFLEELHHRQLMQPDTLFLMVTAETTAAKVMAAIEYQPDAYLTKPFTKEQLEQRLARLFARNLALRPIHAAIKEGDREAALQACDGVAENHPKYRLSALRLKTRLLEASGDLDAALATAEEATSIQPVLWAQVAIGRIQYGKGQVETALKTFVAAAETFPNQVSVLDWIARCQESLGAMEEAEAVLTKAANVSPKNVERQTLLARIAEQLQHHEIARRAYGRAIKEGQHSCMLTADHYRHFFDNSTELVKEKSARERTRLVEESERFFKELESQYRRQPAVLAANQLAMARLNAQSARSDQAHHYLEKVQHTLEQEDCELTEADAEYMHLTLDALGDMEGYDDQAKALTSLVDKALQRRHQQIGDHEEQARLVNEEGKRLVKDKQPLDALDKFLTAHKLNPTHPSYILNAVQVIYENSILKNDDKYRQLARDLLASVHLEKEDERHHKWNTFHAAFR